MFEIHPEKIHVGMRTVKTGLSVGLCALLFHVLDRGSPMLACLAAVFALRENVQRTVYFGFRRSVGNAAGGGLAVALVLIKMTTGLSASIDIIGSSLAIVCLIVLFNFLGIHEAIIGGSATFLMIYFNIEANDSIIYAFQRVVDTVIGSGVALFVNWTLMKYPVGEKGSVPK